MARKDHRESDKGRVKFRFVEFELDGSNATIEESIRNIVSSMTREGSSRTRQLITGGQVTTANQLKPGVADPTPTPPEAPDYDPTDIVSGDPTSRETTSRVKRTRRYTEPSFLSELDLESGEVPFKAFAQRIDPNSDNHRYLVIAAWLKKHRGLDEITIDHIYTCNQAMGWKTQRDVSQPFRYMKRKSYFDHPSKDSWRIR